MKLEPFRNRGVTDGQRVAVYRNTNKHCWSIMDRPNGIVLAHAEAISLYTCEFKVNMAGQRRALIEGRKNVHAVVVGTYQPFGRFCCDTPARYDIERGGFYTLDTDEKIRTAKYVDMTHDGRMRVEKINQN